MPIDLPASLTLNAWDGAPVAGAVSDDASRFGSAVPLFSARGRTLAPPAEVDPRHWWHQDVGWGVVLRDNDSGALSDASKCQGDDAPEPIRRLLRDRLGSSVLRYRPESGDEKLFRYFDNGLPRQELAVGFTDYGAGIGKLPRYLLIVGPPSEIPWTLQYSLNRTHCVGRLDLDDVGLDNYVSALIDNWSSSAAVADRCVVWTCDGPDGDILREMRKTVAKPCADELRSDPELVHNVVELAAQQATCNELINALETHQPALVVTVSHGATGPTGAPDEMRRNLGVPVDQTRTMVDLDVLTRRWKPGGAIWYSHACCSAGSDSGTQYERLLKAGSDALNVCTAVGNLGAQTAPLPRELLGASRPLRAFVGHVEPTFDWTLRQAETLQHLTTGLVAALYPNLYHRKPIGLALTSHYRRVGEIYSQWAIELAKLNDGNEGYLDARGSLFRLRLTALDFQSVVVLGDPTACLPPLPSQRSDARS